MYRIHRYACKQENIMSSREIRELWPISKSSSGDSDGEARFEPNLIPSGSGGREKV